MSNHWILLQMAKEHQADLVREAEKARRSQDLKNNSRLSAIVKNLRVMVMSRS